MKLYGTLTSPYVRKARIVFAEKKIDYEFVLCPPWDSKAGVASAELRKVTPLGKVPVLVLDDSFSLFDSRVIVEYLDGLAANNRLLPQSGRELIIVRRWEALADGICDAASSCYLESQRPASERSGVWMERQKQKIIDALALSDSWLKQAAPWCQGTAISLADIAIGSALGYLSFRFPELSWETEHENLAQLYKTLMQRPSFKSTVPAAPQ